jgi:hypothetical protein
MKTGDLIMLGLVAVGGYLIYTNWGSISSALTPAPAAPPVTGGSTAIPSSSGGITLQSTPSAVNTSPQAGVIPQSTPPQVVVPQSYPNLGNGSTVQAAIARGWTQSLSILNSAVPTVFTQQAALAGLAWWLAQPNAADATIASDVSGTVAQQLTCTTSWSAANQTCGLQGYRRVRRFA